MSSLQGWFSNFVLSLLQATRGMHANHWYAPHNAVILRPGLFIIDLLQQTVTSAANLMKGCQCGRGALNQPTHQMEVESYHLCLKTNNYFGMHNAVKAPSQWLLPESQKHYIVIQHMLHIDCSRDLASIGQSTQKAGQSGANSAFNVSSTASHLGDFWRFQQLHHKQSRLSDITSHNPKQPISAHVHSNGCKELQAWALVCE